MDQKNKKKEEFQGLGFGRLFLGSLIMMIGASYLAERFGLVEVNVGFIISHFWSLFIVWIGFSLLSPKNRVIHNIGILLVTAVLIVVTFYTINSPQTFFSGLARDLAVKAEPTARQAEINVRSGAILLKISAGNDDTGSLISGKLESDEGENSLPSSVVVDGIQKININTESDNGFDNLQNLSKNLKRLDLKISDRLPVNLNVTAAAADLDIDLSKIRAEQVFINSGASNLRYFMSDLATTSRTKLVAAASTIKIIVPKDLGVKFHFISNFSLRNVPNLRRVELKNGNLRAEESVYETVNYEMATQKADVILETGISRVEIEGV